MATRTLTRDGTHVYLFLASTGGVWECPIDFESEAIAEGWVFTDGPPGVPVGAQPLTKLQADALYAGRLEPASYTYNQDGTVATETVGGSTTTYAYNLDGSVHTAIRNGITLTYTYDGSGNVTAVA